MVHQISISIEECSSAGSVVLPAVLSYLPFPLFLFLLVMRYDPCGFMPVLTIIVGHDSVLGAGCCRGGFFQMICDFI
jgi:hypothetical protein